MLPPEYNGDDFDEDELRLLRLCELAEREAAANAWEEHQLILEAESNWGISDAEERLINRYVSSGAATLAEVDMFMDTTGYGMTR